jgi:hypothetical protein
VFRDLELGGDFLVGESIEEAEGERLPTAVGQVPDGLREKVEFRLTASATPGLSSKTVESAKSPTASMETILRRRKKSRAAFRAVLKR